jgi:hypothetical protein
MPVTNYYTVDGRILGESTGGSRIDYLPEALGSVVGTVSSDGSLQRQYRYKPYGGELWSPGSGVIPGYLWSDVMPASLQGASYSHYGVLYYPQWAHTSRRSAMAGAPMQTSGPKLHMRTFGCIGGGCGSAYWSVQFRIDQQRKPFEYYIVQEVLILRCVTHCEGGHKAPVHRCYPGMLGRPDCYPEKFYEAWHVSVDLNGNYITATNNLIDRWVETVEGPCTIKNHVTRGCATIVSPSKYKSWGFKLDPSNECAGILETRVDTPPGWSCGSSSDIDRTMTSYHSCCCDGKEPDFAHCAKGEVRYSDHPSCTPQTV